MHRMLTATLALAAITAFAEPAPAPFGLTWGISAQALSEGGITLKAGERKGNLLSMTTRELPLDLEHAELYFLLFDDEAGLVKVQYVSSLIHGDPNGMHGRERYRELKLALSEKYGLPEVHEIFGLAEFTGPDQFYQCLNDEKCGWWHSTYRHGDLAVRLELNGTAEGTGFVTLQYESAEFRTALGRYELEHRARGKEAL